MVVKLDVMTVVSMQFRSHAKTTRNQPDGLEIEVGALLTVVPTRSRRNFPSVSEEQSGRMAGFEA